MPFFNIEVEATFMRKLSVHVQARDLRSGKLAVRQVALNPNIEDTGLLTVLSDEYVDNDGEVTFISSCLTTKSPVKSDALRQAQQATEQLAFIKRVAELLIWGEPDPGNDGAPFDPVDGVDDSHTCLMSLIEEARTLIRDDNPDGAVRLGRVCVPGYVVDLDNPAMVERAQNALIDDVLAAANHGEIHHLVRLKRNNTILPRAEDMPSWADDERHD